MFEKSPDATPVTDSSNDSVYVNEVALVGVVCVEVNDETDGGVESAAAVFMVTLDASASELGPVFDALSLTEPDARRITTVPSVVQTTLTVIVVPDAADGVKEEQVAVPDALLKSAAAIPDTFSENTSV